MQTSYNSSKMYSFHAARSLNGTSHQFNLEPRFECTISNVCVAVPNRRAEFFSIFSGQTFLSFPSPVASFSPVRIFPRTRNIVPIFHDPSHFRHENAAPRQFTLAAATQQSQRRIRFFHEPPPCSPFVFSEPLNLSRQF